VLGGLLDRQTPCLKKKDSIGNLTKLWHKPLTLTIDKDHNLPKRDKLKDS
jgi:hypothetical protein